MSDTPGIIRKIDVLTLDLIPFVVLVQADFHDAVTSFSRLGKFGLQLQNT